MEIFYWKIFVKFSEADDEESQSEVEIPPEVGQMTSSRRYGELDHNWSDFFFMLDILASNFSVADVLIFVSKIENQISGFIVEYWNVKLLINDMVGRRYKPSATTHYDYD